MFAHGAAHASLSSIQRRELSSVKSNFQPVKSHRLHLVVRIWTFCLSQQLVDRSLSQHRLEDSSKLPTWAFVVFQCTISNCNACSASSIKCNNANLTLKSSKTAQTSSGAMKLNLISHFFFYRLQFSSSLALNTLSRLLQFLSKSCVSGDVVCLDFVAKLRFVR